MTIFSLGWNDEEQQKIPDDTENLIFGFKFKNEITEDYIPQSVIYITIWCSIKSIINNLPFGIKKLSINENDIDINNLPISLETITIYQYNPQNKIRVPFGCKILDNYGNEIIV
jgi:hypothetical protein